MHIRDFYRLKDIYKYMLNDSILIQHGLIDKAVVLKQYQELCNDQSDDLIGISFFRTMLYVESNLRSLGMTSLAL